MVVLYRDSLINMYFPYSFFKNISGYYYYLRNNALWAYFSFTPPNENFDSTPNQNNLVFSYCTGGLGIIGTGLDLVNGINVPYANIQTTYTSNYLPNSFAQAFSICGWVNTSSIAAGNNLVFLTDMTYLTVFPVNGSSYCFAWLVSPTGDPTNYLELDSQAVAYNSWVFFNAIYDSGSSTMRFGVNGSGDKILNMNGETAQFYYPDTFQIGDSTSKYNAYMDEIGLWSRVLSSGERTYLYNNHSGRTYPFN